MQYNMFYFFGLGIIFLAFIFVLICFFRLKKRDEGTEEMKEIAKIIRDGANTFMKTEYIAIGITVVVVAVLLTIFIEKTAGITFVAGAIASSCVCIFGMTTGTFGNVRTTNAARTTKSIGKTVQVALLGGASIGVPVQSVSLLGIILIICIGGIRLTVDGGGLLQLFPVNSSIMRLSTFGLGCSLVAMFNRVGGGNYTKAADISADIVAKIRHDMPEDDSRMPNTIADFIGDLVNDIAGNCSDLLESFTATIVSTIMIAALIADGNEAMFKATVIYPIVLASGGLLSCLIGLSFVLLHKASDNPSKELNMSTYISAGMTVLIGGFGSWYIFKDLQLYDSFAFGWLSPWIPSVLGIISGVAIGKITEYFTSTNYKPVKKLVRSSLDGPAFLITLGEALGSKSTLLPVLVIGISLFISGKICGIYGIAIASLGMLSFVATTVSIDAFGPISDNAGGIAESCRLPHEVRVITDMLDAVGNTTAAIGKGFAIGSAAYATISLISAYVGGYSENPANPLLNIASFTVMAGALIGGALVEFFAALLAENTIMSAHALAVEGDRQLSIPGVIEGKVKPDYQKCISLASRNALARMVLPSILALLIPVVAGFIFGAPFVGGILIGATIMAIPRAIFFGNAGGSWDNAKKYIEEGLLKLTPADIAQATGLLFTEDEIKNGVRKKCEQMADKNHKNKELVDDEFTYEEVYEYVMREAHKTTVTGDTKGDTDKDVIGVALDIFIKTMSTVANNIAPIIVNVHLV